MATYTKLEVIEEIESLEKEAGLTKDKAIEIIKIQENKAAERDEDLAKLKEICTQLAKENKEVTPADICNQAGVRPTTANIAYVRSLKSRLAVTHQPKQAAE